jgi:hypothetical protein
MIQLNHPYKCRHCKTVYVVLRGHGWFGYLPVEVITGTEQFDPEFDKEKHKSHLLNCPPLQQQWMTIRKIIAKQESDKEKQQIKLLLK